MVRNSKRRAFTIVELVIVIAVIAILAAVMIPTFGGVIESANVSADKQILPTVNSQIAIYTGLGNKIETEADLWKALKGDFNGGSDMTAKFDPRSAKNGYHYWYDAAEQTVKLLTYEEVVGTTRSARYGKMVVRAAETRAAEDFAPTAPRTIVRGYYLLDTKCENNNEIAGFYDLIADMSNKTNDDYKGAIATIDAIKGDNKTLAEAVVERMTETVIMTDKGAFINTTTDTIKYIYIPENNTTNTDNYYLSHTVIHANDADVKDLLAIATGAANSVIELPANIKVAEGSFVGFANITIKTEADGTEGITAIFSAGSVASNATVLDKNGASHTINGADVMQGENKVATLTYRNPVTGFDISATGNVAIRTGNNYIALDKIKNGITLTGTTSNFTAADANLAIYTDVVWSTETAGVTIDPDTGVVTFADDFAGETVTIKATAVAVNEGTVEKEFTMTVVRITGATVEFMSGTNSGSQTIANGQTYKPDSFLVTYEDAETTANFKELINPTYGNGITFNAEETEKLGLTAPNVVFTTTGNYFTVGTDKTFTFTNVSNLMGSIGEQNVTATVSDHAGDAFSATITVTVNDNTNTPFKAAIPTYTNNYVYKVGNANTIALEEFFAEKVGVANLSEYKIYVFAQEPELDGDGYYHFGTPVKAYDNPAATQMLDFAGQTGYRWIVLATVGEVSDGEVVIEGIEKQETISMVKVEVIPGENITADSPVFVMKDDRTYGQTIYTKDVVLHDNVVLEGHSKASVILLQSGADLYGNYFEIEAKSFDDADSTTSDKNSEKPAPGVEVASGYGFITMYGNSAINNLILDGPVYPEISNGSSTNGFYFFGVVSQSTGNEINGSYLFGFCSPVRVQGNGITISDTVLEGGTWSNLFINNSSVVTLNNVTTMQNHIDGYAPTLPRKDGKEAKNVVGMGIYIHDDQKLALTINLNGKTTQYNWIANEKNSNFDGNIELAKQIVFKDAYKDLIHTDSDNKQYVNAAVAYQCMNLGAKKVLGISLSKWFPLVTMPSIQVEREDKSIEYMTQKIENMNMKGKDVADSMGLKELLTQKGIPSYLHSTVLSMDIPFHVAASSAKHDTTNGSCPACLENFNELPDVFDEFVPVEKNETTGEYKYND